jgi:hypothetical protein
MAQADRSPSQEETRAGVVGRYSALARAARAGQQITDCDPGAATAGCFGAAGYADVSELPEAAVRASLGCARAGRIPRHRHPPPDRLPPRPLA